MKRVFETMFAVALVAAVVMGSAAMAEAANVPSTITVQGRLTTTGGNPPAAGTKTFTFKIFSAQTLGTEIWPAGAGETQSISTDAQGLWTADVGAVVPLTHSVFDVPTRWLQVTVQDGANPPETLSRIAIRTSPYAFRVATLDGAEVNDTMGIRDPGGNIATYGANGMAFMSSGGPASGPKGITFSLGPDTTVFIGYPFDHIPGVEMRSDTGMISYPFDGTDPLPRQLFLTTGDAITVGVDTAHGPVLFMRDSSAGMPENELLLSAGGGLAYSGTNTGNGHFGPGGLLMTGQQGTDTTGFWNPLTGRVGINTGHPTEALTVGGAIRGHVDDELSDPWVGARKGVVLAKDGADEWGRSAADSAGIYLPSNTSDYSILSSKTSATQTIMRMSVGDDPDDHILLMPSGGVGVKKTSPLAALDVMGMVRADSGFKFSDGSVQTSAAVSSGVAQTVGTNSLPDPFTTLEPVLSVSITCPAAGYVLVMGLVDVQLPHTTGTVSAVDIGVSDSDTLFEGDQRKEWLLPSAAPTGTYLNPIGAQKIFAVSAGSYSFHLLAERVSGVGATTTLDRTLSAMYFPVSYGTVGLSSEGSHPGVVSSASGVSYSPPPSELEQMRQELASLRREIELIKGDQR